ncbi:MAG: hypothetical protein H6837_00725 [Planctomycetes bacterium]|nr:hypothetical protein [Planctomycetota bacterium]
MKTRTTTSTAAAVALLTLCLPAALFAQGTPPGSDKQKPPATETPPLPPGTIPVDGSAPQGRVPPHAPVTEFKTGAPNTWFFERTRLFMGEFLDKEKVSGSFKFKNPTGKPIEWNNLMGSCQCTQADITVRGPDGVRKYQLGKQPVANSLNRLDEKDGKITKVRVTHINIGPQDHGLIEVHMEMGGLQGYKDATLSITTTDPGAKQITLSWQAKGVKLFTITPNEVYLNDMKWGDKRNFSFVIESAVRPEFQLLDHDKLPEYVKVTSKQQIKRPDGKPAWKVDGEFGPNADPKAGGAGIVFKTDWQDKEVRLSVIATVSGPVTIEPGTFLSFGKIRRGEGAVQKVTIKPNGDFKLALKSVEFPRLTFDKKYISATGELVGKDLVVSVKIAPEVRGPMLVRGAMVLSLNHPAVQGKQFTFNGILR